MPPRSYPPARRSDTVGLLHGRSVRDPYRWLEEGSSEECGRWLTAPGRALRL
ncbi:hypothetical protein [Streptomyces osmaniensis]|uniref:hypothetical protein n=1 Tax=Streptomyces osmaniensis TaxID=593134 RepID=UPI001C32B832|nr:hypothetical protein KJK32_45865 [Streptomyces sp. JCM17656]